MINQIETNQNKQSAAVDGVVLWLFVRFVRGFWRAAGVRWDSVHALGLACLLGFLSLVRVFSALCQKVIDNLGAWSKLSPVARRNATMKTDQERFSAAYDFWIADGAHPAAARELAWDQLDFEDHQNEPETLGPIDSLPLHSY